ncbi:enzyme IIB component of PTS [Enterobacterales bacterium]|nr:enzyme IIB component of PTS [Enterobacterales bacterium]
MPLKLVAVTACISGVAHTYMAAERLEKLCAQEKWPVKVETQGALGVENRLTAEDIAQADVVLLIADIMLEESERFNQQRGVQVSIRGFLSDSERVIAAVRKAALSPQQTLIRLE